MFFCVRPFSGTSELLFIFLSRLSACLEFPGLYHIKFRLSYYLFYNKNLQTWLANAGMKIFATSDSFFFHQKANKYIFYKSNWRPWQVNCFRKIPNYWNALHQEQINGNNLSEIKFWISTVYKLLTMKLSTIVASALGLVGASPVENKG